MTAQQVVVVLDDALLDAPVDVGVLSRDRRGSVEVVRFFYSQAWLDAADTVRASVRFLARPSSRRLRRRRRARQRRIADAVLVQVRLVGAQGTGLTRSYATRSIRATPSASPSPWSSAWGGFVL